MKRCDWCGEVYFPAICDLECRPKLHRYGQLPDGGAVMRAMQEDALAAFEEDQTVGEYLSDTRGTRWSAGGVLEPDRDDDVDEAMVPDLGPPLDARCLVCGGGCTSRPPRPPTCSECWDIRSWRVKPAIEEWRRGLDVVAAVADFFHRIGGVS